MFQDPDLLLYVLLPQLEERRAEVRRHQHRALPLAAPKRVEARGGAVRRAAVALGRLGGRRGRRPIQVLQGGQANP